MFDEIEEIMQRVQSRLDTWRSGTEAEYLSHLAITQLRRWLARSEDADVDPQTLRHVRAVLDHSGDATSRRRLRRHGERLQAAAIAMASRD